MFQWFLELHFELGNPITNHDVSLEGYFPPVGALKSSAQNINHLVPQLHSLSVRLLHVLHKQSLLQLPYTSEVTSNSAITPKFGSSAHNRMPDW